MPSLEEQASYPAKAMFMFVHKLPCEEAVIFIGVRFKSCASEFIVEGACFDTVVVSDKMLRCYNVNSQGKFILEHEVSLDLSPIYPNKDTLQ